jgi:hypothetical protein
MSGWKVPRRPARKKRLAPLDLPPEQPSDDVAEEFFGERRPLSPLAKVSSTSRSAREQVSLRFSAPRPLSGLDPPAGKLETPAT